MTKPTKALAKREDAAQLHQVVDMKGLQCSECNKVLEWKKATWESDYYISSACLCENGTRFYKVHRAAAPGPHSSVHHKGG